MTINGLDISIYQEDGGQRISWASLAHDPMQFKFIWIKCAEGELMPSDAGAYPVADFRRQMNGAQSIGLKRAPYHFYYYHVYIGGGSYYRLSPYVQAQAFRAAAAGYEGDLPPLVDLEDPFLTRPVNMWGYTDTPTANLALDRARKLSNHIRQYLDEVERLFGRRPVIYTGAWWWNPWAQLVQTYAPGELAWASGYDYYLADYVHPTPTLCIGQGRVIAHQYTSTPNPGIAAIPNGDHVDCARWMRSDEEYLAWSGTAHELTLEERVAELERRVDALEMGG